MQISMFSFLKCIHFITEEFQLFGQSNRVNMTDRVSDYFIFQNKMKISLVTKLFVHDSKGKQHFLIFLCDKQNI